MKKHGKRKKIIITIAVIVALIILFSALAGFLTNLLWFREMGYISVFLTELITQLEFGVPTFVVITAICYLYLRAIKKSYYKKIGTYSIKGTEKGLNRAALILSGLFGLISAIAIANRLWFQLLQFLNSSDFAIADPIFHRDVSFYIFKLEFLQRINGTLIWIVIGFVIVNIIFYYILLAKRRPDFMDAPPEEPPAEEPKYESDPRFERGGGFFQENTRPFSQSFFGGEGGRPVGPNIPRMNKESNHRLLQVAGTQFKVLAVILFLMIALSFFLKQFSLLYTGSSGVVYGAGFTDINVKLWIFRLQMLLALAGAVAFIVFFNKGKMKKILLIPAAMIALGIVGGLANGLVQNLVVEPDELNKEYPYLQSNIAFTRYAYDLADIDTEDYNIQYHLTAADIDENMATISNIRINDYEPTLKYYNQTQSIRLYYTFNDVDVDRYQVNGEYTQTFLSAREVDENTIGNQWLTQHIKYTHGYGITLSRVDKVSDSGQPDLLIDSIPPVSDVDEIQIENPAIYFGEKTNNYIIVNTDEKEFDYPAGESNVYCDYTGNAGIRMNLINRILFSIRERDLQLLVSTNVNNNSRIIINRNVIQRVETIAPFLHYDEDPYIVSVDGNLYWIFDAYTVSSYYPYSEPYNRYAGTNYIRNSVKVVVDAYNGDTSFYVVDPDDPIAITLQKIYPKLFKDFEAMPESLQAHIRYPNTMFTIQANIFSKYHMTDVNVFYQNEDGWAIATEIYGISEQTMEPTYYIMALPGEKDAEFITLIPYTPSNKNNLTALLVARSDGDVYGDLVLYQMPKDRTIYGPRQVDAQIDQNTEIAQDFTLWNSAGSTYTRGNMFVIPIAGSLMYVEPIYLESSSSSLPEVKKVIISYNERIAYEDTLTEALEAMFGDLASDETPAADGTVSEPSGKPDSPSAASPDELAVLANEAYQNAVKAQQSGDWAAYGRYLDQLAQYLQEMLPSELVNEPAADMNAADAVEPTTEAIPE